MAESLKVTFTELKHKEPGMFINTLKQLVLLQINKLIALLNPHLLLFLHFLLLDFFFLFLVNLYHPSLQLLFNNSSHFSSFLLQQHLLQLSLGHVRNFGLDLLS